MTSNVNLGNLSILTDDNGNGEGPAVAKLVIQPSASTVASDDDAEKRYHLVAEEADESFFNEHKTASRTPYKRNVRMGRGADYYEAFKEFISEGGIGNFKQAVVMNIRLNYIGGLDMIEEKFKVEFFLDMAYWVPKFDRAHHNDSSTIGKFAKFEPQINFPTFLDVKYVGRDTEFSKDKHSRQHECQLGQNKETALHVKKKGGGKSGTQGDKYFIEPPRCFQIWKAGEGLQASKKEKKPVKMFARVSDKESHWPRLWRTLVSDQEISEYLAEKRNPSKPKKELEPTNENPTHMHDRLRELCTFLDARRAMALSHPEEGIVFVTYEMQCEARQAYSLQKFPYDFQELNIVVRMAKDITDPLLRHIVPLAHDKAFFCSGRVPELTEWDITKNMDWVVERGTQGDASRDGGKERLTAKVIVKRKHYYYTTHYILIIFLMTTSVFSAFTFDAGTQIEARSGIIFNLLLTVVAFQYSCADSVPKTPYPTILDGYINLAFILILAVGFVVCLFSYLAVADEKAGHTVPGPSDNYPRYKYAQDSTYNADAESGVGFGLTISWLCWNFYYWYHVGNDLMTTTRMIDEDEQLGWMAYKKAKKNDVSKRRIIDP